MFNSTQSHFFSGILAFLCFPIGFILIAGIIGRSASAAIIPGTFPRDLRHKIYKLRRIYGLCWTSIFYFTPLYHAILSLPITKKILFRLFGYKHSTNFIIYPDTWIRDLPLLSFGEGAYLSNKSTIGTNICLMSGDILVGPVDVGASGLVGHMAMIGPGARIAAKGEVGVGAGVGIRSTVGENSKVGPNCTINHGAIIESNCTIGAMSYIGIKSIIRSGVVVPPGSYIPNGLEIKSNEDVINLINTETQSLQQLKRSLQEKLNQSINKDTIVDRVS